jgi:hypothetical protein
MPRAALVVGSLALAIAALERIAFASEAPTRESVLLLPTLTPVGDDAAGKAVHAPRPEDGEVRARAEELDATLREAVEDSGFSLVVPDADELARGVRDASLVARAAKGERGRWVLSPRIDREGAKWVLRFVAVAPGDRELRVRIDETTSLDLPARALVSLRQLLLRRASNAAVPREVVDPAASAGTLSAPRTSGRMVLALHGAAFGAFAGYAVERTSRTDDSRLLFPLLAVGGSVGAGAAILAADEWNLASESAWALGVAMTAGTLGGFAAGAEYAPGTTETSRYAYGVGGGVAGLALGIVGVTNAVGPGVAAVFGTGTFLGALGGSLGARLVSGKLESPLTEGLGEGIAVGLVGATVLATSVDVDPNRLVNLDLGAGLGALVGAAAATPFLLDKPSAGTDRAFVTCTLAGTAVGGALGWWLAPAAATARPIMVTPLVGETQGVSVFGLF